MGKEEDKAVMRTGWGCISAVLLPFLAFFLYLFINDYQLRSKIEAEHRERQMLDSRYSEQLKLLDGIFDRVLKRCSVREEGQIVLARDYFHTCEEASNGGSDEYRRAKFEELQMGVKQMTELIEVLE